MRKLAWLLLWLLSLPTFAEATGSLSIPNTLANLAAGSQPLSVIDTNLSTIATYVNAREITAGVCASRPAASVSGRFYLCTDTAGGTLYFDTGSTWTQVAGGVTPSASLPAVRGLVAGTASLTVVNASATLVNLRSPSDGSVVIRTATATISNDVLATGSTVNGRDSVAQFSASSWVHFYYIWNGTTLGSLSSACAPSDVNGSCSSSFGPNLPTGYTHWAYIGAWRYNGSSNFIKTQARGSMITYEATQSAVNAGTATTETAVSLTALIPPNAYEWRGFVHTVNAGIAVAGVDNVYLKYITASPHTTLVFTSNTSTAVDQNTQFAMPNATNQFYYQIIRVSTGGSVSATIDVLGYRVPNGGE